MQKRIIGHTDIAVSVIGLGTVKFGRTENLKYPHGFCLPTDNELDYLLAIASELGINLLDTAPAYGTSEERLGKALKGRRQQWVICTKAGEMFSHGASAFDFSPTAICHSIEQSLRRLNTDYLDVVLVHSNGEDQRIIEQDKVFDTLERCKKDGKVRAFGMSSKTVAGGLQTIDCADVAMVTFNPSYVDEREVIRYAQQNQKSIFIKKAFASGHLPTKSSLDFIFAEAGVTSVIIGTINPEHLRENVAHIL